MGNISMPKLSVIVPMYGVEKYIARCAKSLFAQTLEDIEFIFDKFKPDCMAIERLYFTTNQKTAIDVAQARGVTVLSAARRNIPVSEYTPLQVKLSVTGYGKAEKKQVMEMTRQLLNLAQIPKPDDAADALAIAICHGHSIRWQ